MRRYGSTSRSLNKHIKFTDIKKFNIGIVSGSKRKFFELWDKLTGYNSLLNNVLVFDNEIVLGDVSYEISMNNRRDRELIDIMLKEKNISIADGSYDIVLRDIYDANNLCVHKKRMILVPKTTFEIGTKPVYK